MAETRTTKGVYFENLDGLRFLCFLGVFLMHVFLHLGVVQQVTGPWFELPKNILTLNMNSGEAGVAFFFVLSGFLITYLMLQELRKTGDFSVPQFYMRRTLRIWPLYYAVVIFGFFVCPVLARLMGRHWFERAGAPEFLLFLANFDIFRHGLPANGILGVQWSLAVEEQFYIVWPLIFLMVSRTPGRLRQYPWVFLALIGWSFVFRALHPGDYNVVEFHTFSVMGDLALGGLAAYLAFTSRGFTDRIRDLPRGVIAAVYLAGIAAVAFQEDIFAGQLQPFKRLASASFFAFVILEQSYSLRSWFKMSRFPRITKLGTYTYGLYSLHMIGITLAAMVLSKAPTLSLFLQRMAIATVVTFALGYVSYHFFESYFLGLKERFSPLLAPAKRTAEPAAALSTAAVEAK